MSSPRDVPPGWEDDEEFLRNAVPPPYRPSPSSGRSQPRVASRWIVLGAAAVVLLVAVALFLGAAFARGDDASAQESSTTSAVPSPSAAATATPSTASPTAEASVPPPPDPVAPLPETAPAETGSALNAARALAVAPPSATSSYDRELFAWRGLDLDRNGCDSRNDVLRRDLTDLVVREGTQGCKVDAGTLAEPYTGDTIFFVVGGGPTNDGGVQIDHVVALANAWASGADAWDSATLQTFGNDPLNLLAVDGDANQSKGASNAAEWLPPNAAFNCEYVSRQVAVKTAYSLSVTASELDAMERVLAGCPDQPLPTATDTATP